MVRFSLSFFRALFGSGFAHFACFVRILLDSEMLRGPLMCFDAELKMNAVQLAIHVETQGRLEDITPIVDYAICIFTESAEAHYHRQALWILSTVFIKHGWLRTAVRVLDELIRTHPLYRHSYCQKVELLKADGCSVEEVEAVVRELQELSLQGSTDDQQNGGDGMNEPQPEQQGPEAMDEDDEEDDGDEDAPTSSKARAEAQVLLQNAKRSLASMKKEATSGVTQRVREAIQSRIQLIQTEEISRPVLVSLAAAVAYTHAQRFKLAQDMIGKTIKQNANVAEIFVVRAHVRYTEGSSCDGEIAVRCWNAAVEDCSHALHLNSECWPALWWKAQALSNLSGTEGREGCARDALRAMDGLLEFQPSFDKQSEFEKAHTELKRKVMLADASQCIESREYEKSLVITGRLLDVSPQHSGALRWRATALGEMLKSTTQRLEPLFRDAVEAEQKILAQTKETDTEHVDALARKTETTLQYMKRAGIAASAGREDEDAILVPSKLLADIFMDLNKALQLDSRHRASLLLRARVNESLSKPKETIADCTKMLESDRKSDTAAGQQRLEVSKQAICCCSQSFRFVYNRVVLWLQALGMRARAFMQGSMFREAMADYDNALHICGNTEGLEGVVDQVAALERQKTQADKALQAEVEAAQDRCDFSPPFVTRSTHVSRSVWISLGPFSDLCATD